MEDNNKQRRLDKYSYMRYSFIRSLILLAMLIILDSCKVVDRIPVEKCKIYIELSSNFELVSNGKGPVLNSPSHEFYITLVNNTDSGFTYYLRPNLGYNNETAIDFQYVVYRKDSVSSNYCPFNLDRDDHALIEVNRIEFPVDYVTIKPNNRRTWVYLPIDNLPHGLYRIGVKLNNMDNRFMQGCITSNLIDIKVGSNN